MTKISKVQKDRILVIGDRIETDINGAHSFGLDACWYNPEGISFSGEMAPKFQISHLSELKEMIIRPHKAK